MEDFPSNSRTPKAVEAPAKKKLEPVVTGQVQRRKKRLGKRLGETFVNGDAQSVGQMVLFDVLIPAAKDMVADAIVQGAERMLFGEARPRSASRGHRPGYTPYNTMSKGSQLIRRDEPQRQISKKARGAHDFDEIILESRAQAETVLTKLVEQVEEFGQAAVSDLYELVGVTGEHTDHKWGWTDLRYADVIRARGGGYLLDLPKTVYLD